jgi:hypothetical protein
VPHQQQPVPRGRGVRDRARVEGGLPHPPIQVAAVGVGAWCRGSPRSAWWIAATFSS